MVAVRLAEIATESGLPLWLLIIVIVWSLVWKGLAWWRSARLNQPFWFIAFFIINTVGILEILYIFLLSKINLGFISKSRKRSLKRAKHKK